MVWKERVRYLDHVRRPHTEDIMDILYLAITITFFVITWGFVNLCEKV